MLRYEIKGEFTSARQRHRLYSKASINKASINSERSEAIIVLG